MVYLLHFHRPYKHARHYIGHVSSAANLARRLKHHRNGSGARLMQVISEAGIDFTVARTWPDGDRNFERRLKNQKKPSHFCPMCQAERKIKETVNETEIK